MPVQTGRKAWINCPFNPDQNYWHATTQAGVSLVPEMTTTFVSIYLARKPRIGTLLSVEFISDDESYSPPILARVFGAKQQPEGHWLARCLFDEPMSPEALRALFPSA